MERRGERKKEGRRPSIRGRWLGAAYVPVIFVDCGDPKRGGNWSEGLRNGIRGSSSLTPSAIMRSGCVFAGSLGGRLFGIDSKVAFAI